MGSVYRITTAPANLDDTGSGKEGDPETRIKPNDENNLSITNKTTERRVISEPSKISKLPQQHEQEHESAKDDQFSFVASPPIKVKSLSHPKRYVSLAVPPNSCSSLQLEPSIKTTKNVSISKIRASTTTNSLDTNSPQTDTLNTNNNRNLKPKSPNLVVNKEINSTIRSNGRIDSLSSFPTNQYNSQEYELQMDHLDLDYQLQDSSGSFEINSGDSPQLLYSPFLEQHPRIISNFNEPKDFINDNNELTGSNNIRKSLISQNSLLPNDSFQQYMEGRLIRWKPSDSQHNTEVVMEGRHPFNNSNFGRKVSSSKLNRLSIFNWFSSNKVDIDSETDLEKQNSQAEGYYTANPISNSPSDLMDRYGNNRNHDLDVALKDISMNVKNSSSKSMLPQLNSSKPDPHPIAYNGQGQQQDYTFNDNTNSTGTIIHRTQQPTNIEDPVYTANAIPFSQYELNFNTKNERHHPDPEVNIFDSLGHEVLELINGRDNFITSCFGIFKC